MGKSIAVERRVLANRSTTCIVDLCITPVSDTYIFLKWVIFVTAKIKVICGAYEILQGIRESLYYT